MDEYKSYRVWLRSVPGMYEQYDGKVDVKVDVYATNEDDALEAAFYKLKTSAFPHRHRNMWYVEKIERG